MPAPNPVLIQSGSAANGQLHPGVQPPLFLIHDASGLISAYFKLGDIGRPVYGIYDPKFDDNGLSGWQDVRDMALQYVRLIKRQHSRGEVLLGGRLMILCLLCCTRNLRELSRTDDVACNDKGWSFGGIVAVQIAHILATQGRGLTVSRIILLDTVYPRCERPEATKEGTLQYVPGLEGLNSQTEERLMMALVRANCLADRWAVPQWTMPRSLQAPKSIILPGQFPVPPPVILIRAEEKVSMDDKEAMCVLDRTRFLPQLGWEDQHPDFISEVFPVKGNHYTLFDEPYVSQLQISLFLNSYIYNFLFVLLSLLFPSLQIQN